MKREPYWVDLRGFLCETAYCPNHATWKVYDGKNWRYLTDQNQMCQVKE